MRSSFVHKATPIATESPSGIDIAWAAGIFEGEGCVALSLKKYIYVVIGQNDPWLLYKLQRLFGGSVAHRKQGDFIWCVCGMRARGFVMTIFSYMSPRRRAQIKKALMQGYK